MRGRRKRNILVINGAISLDFHVGINDLYLSSQRRHVSGAVWVVFFPPPCSHFLPLSQTGAVADRSAVGKYQSHTFTCRRFITSALAVATVAAVARGGAALPKRAAAEELLHNLEERDSAQLLCLNRASLARRGRRTTTTLWLGDCGMRGFDARTGGWAKSNLKAFRAAADSPSSRLPMLAGCGRLPTAGRFNSR